MKKNKPLAIRQHPLLPLSVNIHYGPDDPPCPLLAGFHGHFVYQSDMGATVFPEHESMEGVKSVKSFLENGQSNNAQVFAFAVFDRFDEGTECAFVIGKGEAEQFLPKTGKGWKVDALAYFVPLSEKVSLWAAGEGCYRAELVVSDKVVAELPAVWGDDEDAALEVAVGLLKMDGYAGKFWDVLPDHFPWSARLKRAMNDLLRHCEKLGEIEAMLGDFGYGLEDVPTMEDLALLTEDMPGEPEPMGVLAANFVRAWHIARGVAAFDWETADEQTLRRHPFWLSLEPSQEFSAPALPFGVSDTEPAPL